jgi:hypothetical protein
MHLSQGISMYHNVRKGLQNDKKQKIKYDTRKSITKNDLNKGTEQSGLNIITDKGLTKGSKP